jgi:hypothetical protein
MRANTCYALGALALRVEQHGKARDAFGEALALVPAHRLAAVGLAATNARSKSTSNFKHRTSKRAQAPQPGDADVSSVDAVIARAAALVLQGQHVDAARLVGDALLASEPGPAGWLLPVEPLIHPTTHADLWVRPLAAVAERAV